MCLFVGFLLPGVRGGECLMVVDINIYIGCLFDVV